MTEGSLEVKLPTTWRDGKAEVGRVREETERRREEERRKSEKKEDAGARKGVKVAILLPISFFPELNLQDCILLHGGHTNAGSSADGGKKRPRKAIRKYSVPCHHHKSPAHLLEACAVGNK